MGSHLKNVSAPLTLRAVCSYILFYMKFRSLSFLTIYGLPEKSKEIYQSTTEKKKKKNGKENFFFFVFYGETV